MILGRWGQPWIAIIQNSHACCLIEGVWMGTRHYHYYQFFAFFSLTVYIKFMPAEHNLFMILVGHTWEKAYKKRVSGINHCVCCWAFLGEMCLSDTFVCVGSSDTVSLWVMVLAKSVWMERQAHTWNTCCFWPMVNGCYYQRGRSPIMSTC